MVSLIGQAFEDTESILSPELTSDMSTTDLRDKVLYTNLDERASIEAMPTYIREGGIRYATTPPPMDEASVNNYFGGGDVSGACVDFIVNTADENVPVTGDFLIVRSIADSPTETRVGLAMISFVDGCLVQVENEVNHQLVFQKKVFTVCGGDTTDVCDVSGNDFTGG